MSFLAVARLTNRPALRRARPADAEAVAAILAAWVDETAWLPQHAGVPAEYISRLAESFGRGNPDRPTVSVGV